MFTLSQSSRIGIAHINGGTPNQDSYGSIIEDGYAVLVVADGAGSLKLSHTGSQEAVFTALESIKSSGLEPNTPREDLERFVADAIFLANDTILNNPNGRDMGCTMAVAIVNQAGWATGCYGDSFAIVRTGDDYVFSTGEQEHEFANITNLLGRSEDIIPIIQSGDTVPLGVAVSTDGLLRISVKKNRPTAGFWDVVFNENGINGDAFLEFLDNKGKLDDDTTFVSVVIQK